MLLRAIFLVALIAVLADTFVHGAISLATTALHERALDAAQSEIIQAATAVQQTIANGVAAGTLPVTVPSPAPTCVAGSGGTCALVATTSITLAQPSAEPSASACPQASCTTYLQGNDLVAEGRISATIATSIASASGQIFAQRTALVVFRTLAQPPYAALAGSLDGSTAGLLANGTGDDGGAAPQASSDGTLIDVLYKNSVTGVTTPANVWSPRTQYAAPISQPWDP